MLALEDQPNVLSYKNGGYFFLPPGIFMNQLGIRGKHIKSWTQDERDWMMRCYQNCFNELDEHIKAAEAAGKMAVVKEHSCFLAEPTAQSKFLFGGDSVNESPWTVHFRGTRATTKLMTQSLLSETILPDGFLQMWSPTFLIRHPAMSFPSYYRTLTGNAGEMEEEKLSISMSLHWTRTLYEWYAVHPNESKVECGSGGVAWPLVLDADDIITDPRVISKFCGIVGLDPTKVRFTWSRATGDEILGLPRFLRRMTSTLLASTGVISENVSANLNLDLEAKKWRDEFGDYVGNRIENWVRAAMPDYEFMSARKLRVTPA